LSNCVSVLTKITELKRDIALRPYVQDSGVPKPEAQVTAEKISLAEYLLNLAAMMIKADSMDTKKALKKFEECQLILESEDQENPKISMMQRQV